MDTKQIAAKMAELTDGYNIERGIIMSPGKFEGEPTAVLFYYDSMMNGDGEPLGDGMIGFKVSPEEAKAFDIQTPYVVLIESDSGFVTIEEADEREYKAYEMESEMEECYTKNEPIKETVETKNKEFGFWGTLEAPGVEEYKQKMWDQAILALMNKFDIEDEIASAFLDSTYGRHMADFINDGHSIDHALGSISLKTINNFIKVNKLKKDLGVRE